MLKTIQRNKAVWTVSAHLQGYAYDSKGGFFLENRFVVPASPPDAPLLPQIVRILDTRLDHASRKRFPKWWRLIDRISNRSKGEKAVQHPKRGRRIVLGLVNWVLGMVLLLPGLMEPDEMPFLLVVGIIGFLIGLVTLWCHQKILLAVLSLLAGSILTFGGVVSPDELGCFLPLGIFLLVIGILALCTRRKKKSSAEKAAKKLLSQQAGKPTAEVVFTENGLEIPGQPPVPYQDFEAIFETEDLIAPIFHNQIVLLKKEELPNDAGHLLSFLAEHAELVQA